MVVACVSSEWVEAGILRPPIVGIEPTVHGRFHSSIAIRSLTIALHYILKGARHAWPLASTERCVIHYGYVVQDEIDKL